MKPFYAIAAAALLLGASRTHAGILLSWDFAGQGGAASSAAQTVDPTISAISPSGVASLGAGLSPINYLGNGLTAKGVTATTLADALTNNQYLTFTIAPDAGYYMSLTSIDLRPVSQNRPRTFSLFDSVDGFASGDQIADFTYKGNFGPGTPQTISLTGLGNLNQAVEFRLYAYADVNKGAESIGLGNANGTDLVINGTTNAIPEPTSLALLGLGGLLILPRRKKSQLG